MKRVFLILTLAAIAGLVLAREARAMTASGALAVQVAQGATGHHPGHFDRGRHGYGYGYGPYRPTFGGPVFVPVGPPPMIVRPPVQPYPYYYGCPGAIRVQGRGWAISLGF